MNISVTIEYKLINGDKCVLVNIEPEKYFDQDPDNEIDVDSIPRFNHATDYLNINQEKINFTAINLQNKEANKHIKITETFWNNGKNRVIERLDTHNGQETFWLLIQEVLLKSPPSLWQIIRFYKKDGIITPISHVIIEEKEDGTEEEIKILP